MVSILSLSPVSWCAGVPIHVCSCSTQRFLFSVFTMLGNSALRIPWRQQEFTQYQQTHMPAPGPAGQNLLHDRLTAVWSVVCFSGALHVPGRSSQSMEESAEQQHHHLHGQVCELSMDWRSHVNKVGSALTIGAAPPAKSDSFLWQQGQTSKPVLIPLHALRSRFGRNEPVAWLRRQHCPPRASDSGHQHAAVAALRPLEALAFSLARSL